MLLCWMKTLMNQAASKTKEVVFILYNICNRLWLDNECFNLHYRISLLNFSFQLLSFTNIVFLHFLELVFTFLHFIQMKIILKVLESVIDIAIQATLLPSWFPFFWNDCHLCSEHLLLAPQLVQLCWTPLELQLQEYLLSLCGNNLLIFSSHWKVFHDKDGILHFYV